MPKNNQNTTSSELENYRKIKVKIDDFINDEENNKSAIKDSISKTIKVIDDLLKSNGSENNYTNATQLLDTLLKSIQNPTKNAGDFTIAAEKFCLDITSSTDNKISQLKQKKQWTIFWGCIHACTAIICFTASAALMLPFFPLGLLSIALVCSAFSKAISVALLNTQITNLENYSSTTLKSNLDTIKNSIFEENKNNNNNTELT